MLKLACSSFRPIRSIPLSALAAVVCASAASAAPQAWGVQIGTGAGESVSGVAADDAGGTFECGFSLGTLGGAQLGKGDAYLTRRDGAGNVLWSSKVATPEIDEGIAVAADGAGGAYLAGNQAGVIDVHWSTDYDAFVARFDAAGNLLWQRTIGAAQYEHVTSCAADGAGGVFVTGVTYVDASAAAFQDGDVWLARIDAAGNLLWLDSFGSTDSDFSARVETDGSGGVLLCGLTSGDLAAPLDGTFDAWYARYDGGGNLLWMHQFGAGSGTHTRASGLALDGTGGFYLAGGTTGLLDGSWQSRADAFLGRYDAEGDLVWMKQLGSAADDLATDVAVDAHGFALLLGSTTGQLVQGNAGLVDVWIWRFDGVATGQEATQIGSQNSDGPRDLVAVGSGVFAGGSTIGLGFLFGSKPTGNQSGWVARFETCDLGAKVLYCGSGINSTGNGSAIGNLGTVGVSNNDFGLFANKLPVGEAGLFLMSETTQLTPFGNGFLCLGGTVHRLGTASTANGFASRYFDVTDPSSAAALIAPGSTWNFQFWYRDTAGGGAGFNLSNALSVTFCP